MFKKALVSTLRNVETETSVFRRTSHQIAHILANELFDDLSLTSVQIETPLVRTEGCEYRNEILLVPILRAGLALLQVFVSNFEKAKVGFFGMQRDEATAEAEIYYQNIPPITAHTDVVILDPMVATGGSAFKAVEGLLALGASIERIRIACIVAAPEGLAKIHSTYPQVKIYHGALDEGLNDRFFIVPGLGDFGDRYFGTEHR